MRIRYRMTPRPDWSWDEIRDRLSGIAKDMAHGTGFLEVKDVQEFRRINWRWTSPELHDNYYDVLLKSGRYTNPPEAPWCRLHQEAQRCLVVVAQPDDADERFSVGCAEYEDTVTGRNYGHLPWWELLQIVEHPTRYPEAKRTLNRFIRKYNLRLTWSLARIRRWLKAVDYTKQLDVGPAMLVTYYYCSAARRDETRRRAIIIPAAMPPPAILMRFPDGSIFTQEFVDDLARLLGYGSYRLDDCREWNGEYHTQRSRATQFLAVHQGVCTALKLCEERGFNVKVEDRTGFWGTWDVGRLLQQIDASAEDRDQVFEVLGGP